MAIFYHGSNKLFKKFDPSYSKHNNLMFVSPCKNMSLSYIPRTGGYLYTIELDESNKDYTISKEYGNPNCTCRAYSNFSNFKILKVERIEYDGIPTKETKCGTICSILQRQG